jgi:hypothetical protein
MVRRAQPSRRQTSPVVADLFCSSLEQMEDSLLLLRFNCPSKQCDYIASGWQDLRVHVRVAHKTELWCVAAILAISSLPQSPIPY